jgi:hypothetical protein
MINRTAHMLLPTAPIDLENAPGITKRDNIYGVDEIDLDEFT